MNKKKLTPGTRVQITLDGKVKKGVIIDTVPTLWGGDAFSIRVDRKEIVISAQAIINK